MAWPFLDSELNRSAASFHVATFILTCAALVLPNWFRTKGGMHCLISPLKAFSSELSDRDEYRTQINPFDDGNIRTASIQILNFMDPSSSCLTPKIASLMRVLILLCVLILMLSLVGIFINLSASSHHFIKAIRKNAVPSILCVFWVIAIIGVSYYVTVMLELEAARINAGPVYVTYEYGFYTITVAGGFALLASAANLWGELTPRDDLQRRNLIDNWDGRDNDANERLATIRPALPPYSARPPNFIPRIMRQSRSAERPAANSIDTYYPFDDMSALPPPPPYSP